MLRFLSLCFALSSEFCVFSEVSFFFIGNKLIFLALQGHFFTDISIVMVVLPDPFREMGSWRNFTETQQSGYAVRSGPEVKNGRSSAEDGAPERQGCETVKEEVSRILQRVSAGKGATRKGAKRLKSLPSPSQS